MESKELKKVVLSKKFPEKIEGDLDEAEDKKLLLKGLAAFGSRKPPPLEQETAANSRKVKDELGGTPVRAEESVVDMLNSSLPDLKREKVKALVRLIKTDNSTTLCAVKSMKTGHCYPTRPVSCCFMSTYSRSSRKDTSECVPVSSSSGF